MTAKSIVISGATSGIGRATALALAEAGHEIHVLVRDTGKATLLLDELRTLNRSAAHSFVQCDLSSLKSVDTAAHILLNKLERIDVLINNAGGIFQSREVSADGYELSLALNHLGPFHLTNRLLDLLPEHQDARIINVSSAAHTQAKVYPEDLNLEKNWSAIRSYANSKLFNIYTARYWAELLKDRGISAVSLHPGVVDTGFASEVSGIMGLLLNLIKPFMLKSKDGAKTSIHLSQFSGLNRYNGRYFARCRPQKTSALGRDHGLRNTVIEASKELIQKIIGNANNAH